MPAKEIKELRQSGKLDEAYDMAVAELNAQPENIWAKRNISWVLYDFLKLNTTVQSYETFERYLGQIAALQLPEDEKMLFDQLSWQIGKMVFLLLKEEPVNNNKLVILFQHCKQLHFTKPSEGYSFLFKAFHKAFKDTAYYLELADWWDLNNFRAEDYQKDKLPNGKEVMSTAEQAIIAYCKQLLPQTSPRGEVIFNRGKVLGFMPFLDAAIEKHHDYQYPPYFKAKLLLAIGEQENMLSALLSFARKKRNDFWVWDIMSEAFPDNEEQRIACYCKALTCKTSDDFLINIRQKLTLWFISQNKYDEAKTEIESIVKARKANEWKIPNEVKAWMDQAWYKNVQVKKSNYDFYKMYLSIADNLLFSDTPEETVVIEFVNSDKKVANFIASESKYGFFKYGRFIDKLEIGDTLKVRYNGGSNEGMYTLLTARKVDDPTFKKAFLKDVSGELKVPAGKSFGFLEDVFVHPSFIIKHKLTDGVYLKAKAIRSFNQAKKEWSWKVYNM